MAFHPATTHGSRVHDDDIEITARMARVLRERPSRPTRSHLFLMLRREVGVADATRLWPAFTAQLGVWGVWRPPRVDTTLLQVEQSSAGDSYREPSLAETRIRLTPPPRAGRKTLARSDVVGSLGLSGAFMTAGVLLSEPFLGGFAAVQLLGLGFKALRRSGPRPRKPSEVATIRKGVLLAAPVSVPTAHIESVDVRLLDDDSHPRPSFRDRRGAAVIVLELTNRERAMRIGKALDALSAHTAAFGLERALDLLPPGTAA